MAQASGLTSTGKAIKGGEEDTARRVVDIGPVAFLASAQGVLGSDAFGHVPKNADHEFDLTHGKMADLDLGQTNASVRAQTGQVFGQSWRGQEGWASRGGQDVLV